MGYAMSWFAAKHEIPKSVLQQLQARFDKRRKEQMSAMGGINPFIARRVTEGAIIASPKLPGGWWAVIVERDDVTESAADLMASLSADTEVVACFVEEHVMVSEAASWRKNKLLWKVSYNSQKDKNKVETFGELPQQFSGIYSAAKQKQSNPQRPCDYMFDVPVKLAESITGLRYDQIY